MKIALTILLAATIFCTSAIAALAEPNHQVLLGTQLHLNLLGSIITVPVTSAMNAGKSLFG